MYLPSFAMLKTALLVALVCGGGLGFAAAATIYKAAISKMETAQAEREAEIATAVLEAQQTQITQMETALNVAQKQTIQARADADAATAATRKLQSLADLPALPPQAKVSLVPIPLECLPTCSAGWAKLVNESADTLTK